MKIAVYGNKILTEKMVYDPETMESCVNQLGIASYKLHGGLAANQLLIRNRICVTQRDGLITLRNPQILKMSKETFRWKEACFSFPGISLLIDRANTVTVSFLDYTGYPCELEFTGPDAGMVQHEIDHLDGILMSDRRVSDMFSGNKLKSLKRNYAHQGFIADIEDIPQHTNPNPIEEPAWILPTIYKPKEKDG